MTDAPFTCPVRGCRSEGFESAQDAITHVKAQHNSGYSLTYGEDKVSGLEVALSLDGEGDPAAAERVRQIVAARALAREARLQAPIETPAGPLYPGEKVARLHIQPRWGKRTSRREVIVGPNSHASGISVRATTGGRLAYTVRPDEIVEIER